MGSFANFGDYDLLQRCVAHASQTSRPERKYKLDQEVDTGKICGYYWVSIPTSYNEAVYPGWWYIVEYNHEQGHYHESDVAPVEPIAQPPAPESEPPTPGSELNPYELIEAKIIEEWAEGDRGTIYDLLDIITKHTPLDFLLDHIAGLVRMDEMIGKPATAMQVQILELAASAVRN